MTSSYSQSGHPEDANVKSAETCNVQVAENNVPYISCAAVDAIAYNQAEMCVKHGFFTRLGGVSTDIYASLNGGLGSSDNLENVYQNRQLAAEALGATEANIASCFQTHSADCVTIAKPYKDPIADRPYADALVTNQTDILLLLLTADCVPVLFADTSAPFIGAAHAGWRGAVGGILENTVSALTQLGAQKKNLAAVIGPSIRQQSYQIGEEMAEIVRAHHENASACLLTDTEADDQRYLFDLPLFVTQILQHIGIETIYDTRCDTYADSTRFFSHRWATHHNLPDSGRLISAISLQSVSRGR